jgi:hypothetical protein
MCMHHKKISYRDKVTQQNNTGKYNNMVGINAHTKSAVHAYEFY